MRVLCAAPRENRGGTSENAADCPGCPAACARRRTDRATAGAAAALRASRRSVAIARAGPCRRDPSPAAPAACASSGAATARRRSACRRGGLAARTYLSAAAAVTRSGRARAIDSADGTARRTGPCVSSSASAASRAQGAGGPRRSRPVSSAFRSQMWTVGTVNSGGAEESAASCALGQGHRFDLEATVVGCHHRRRARLSRKLSQNQDVPGAVTRGGVRYRYQSMWLGPESRLTACHLVRRPVVRHLEVLRHVRVLVHLGVRVDVGGRGVVRRIA